MGKISEKGSLLEESAANAAEENDAEDRYESTASIDPDLEKFRDFMVETIDESDKTIGCNHEFILRHKEREDSQISVGLIIPPDSSVSGFRWPNLPAPILLHMIKNFREEQILHHPLQVLKAIMA